MHIFQLKGDKTAVCYHLLLFVNNYCWLYVYISLADEIKPAMYAADEAKPAMSVADEDKPVMSAADGAYTCSVCCRCSSHMSCVLQMELTHVISAADEAHRCHVCCRLSWHMPCLLQMKLTHAMSIADEALQLEFPVHGTRAVHGVGVRGSPQSEPAVAMLETKVHRTQGNGHLHVRHPTGQWCRR